MVPSERNMQEIKIPLNQAANDGGTAITSNDNSPMPRSLFSINNGGRDSIMRQQSSIGKEYKKELQKQKSVSILKQVLEESILRTAEDQFNQQKMFQKAYREHNQSQFNNNHHRSSVSELSFKKISESVKKVDLSRIHNFVSASQFNEVMTLRHKIDLLEKENEELRVLNREMNEFKQILDHPMEDIDQRRYHLLKSQVIQLTRQNKLLSDTVQSQSRLVRETERMLQYLEEAVMLSSKKAELIYQKRRERILEKKRQEELLRKQQQYQENAKKKRRKQQPQPESKDEGETIKLYEISIDEYKSRMEEDEIQTLDQVREEQIKELFKSADPRNFIQKLRQTFHHTVIQERRAYQESFYDYHPLIQAKSRNYDEFEYNLTINLNQGQILKCESTIVELFKLLNNTYDTIIIKGEFPTSKQINQAKIQLRQSIDQLLLLGLLPVGQIHENKKHIIVKNSNLISQNNYEQWAKYVSDRVQRETMPRMLPSTCDKFISVNNEFIDKERLLNIIRTSMSSKKNAKKLMMNLMSEVFQINNKHRAQIILLSRENTLIKNFQNESQKHLEKFTEFIYSKYNFFAKDFKQHFYKPYKELCLTYKECKLHDNAKKYVMAFLEQFEKTSSDHFQKAFDLFYQEQGPDLKINDRLEDLIRAYNANQKLLMQNLNDYEKIMNIRFKKDEEYQHLLKQKQIEEDKRLAELKEKEQNVDEDANENQKGMDNYETFVKEIKKVNIYNQKSH
ncbi:UNKNOWN [Stylonychia lemnae]|uniref:Uncharacterized protein n=1 Tax=Stylonychia lemnae TaxID=5949 RepID=A0A078A6Z7_STYLE|nr:UNKNOWN [Stylonychia lemnae]|eukprot:CDW78014.1 UNKNOWN [Stylonychia lemnae]